MLNFKSLLSATLVQQAYPVDLSSLNKVEIGSEVDAPFGPIDPTSFVPMSQKELFARKLAYSDEMNQIIPE